MLKHSNEGRPLIDESRPRAEIHGYGGVVLIPSFGQSMSR